MERLRFTRYLAVWDAEIVEKKGRHTRYARTAPDGRVLTAAIANYNDIPPAVVTDVCKTLKIPEPREINDRPKNAPAARRDTRRKNHD